MIFYNAIVRFVFLNALKFNMSSMVVFYNDSSSAGSTFVAALLFICFSVAVPIVLIWIVYINRDTLHELKMKLKFGTMYSGRRVIDFIYERRVWVYPATFFIRRTLFAITTVSLFEHPYMQMIVHQFLTMATLVYLCNDDRMFTDNSQRFTEIVSEIFLLLISVLLIQFERYKKFDDEVQSLEISIYVSLGLLMLFNTIFLIYGVVIDCLESKRLKNI